MQQALRVTLLGIAVQLLASGCLFGGSGGGSSSGSLFDGGSGGGTNTLASLNTGSGGSEFAGPIHNPEPVSLALFGSGLVGLGVWRRRKISKTS